MGAASETFLTALGLADRITRRLATRSELRCPSGEHVDRRPSAVTFDNSLVTACSACGRRWSPFDLALQRGFDRRDALALLIELGVRLERRPDAPRRPPRIDHAPRTHAPTEPKRLSTDVAHALEQELVNRLDARRGVDDRLEDLRGFDRRVLDKLGAGYGSVCGLPGFSVTAGNEARVLMPVRDLAGRLVGLVAFRPEHDLPTWPRKSLAAGGRWPLLVHPAEPLADASNLLVAVEGEPAAIAAASVGLFAIGLPGHAGAPAHGARIAAAARAVAADSVLVLPDADVAGRNSFVELASAIETQGIPALYRPQLEAGCDLDDLVVQLLPTRPTTKDRLAVGRQLLDSILDGTEP